MAAIFYRTTDGAIYGVHPDERMDGDTPLDTNGNPITLPDDIAIKRVTAAPPDIDWPGPSQHLSAVDLNTLDLVSTESEAARIDREAREQSLDTSVAILLNNAQVIRDAMDGVSEARAALDSVIPIDRTSTDTIIESLANRQAAVMFLAANSFRAAVHLSESGELPDNIVEAFMK